MNNIFKALLKNIWMKKNYAISEDKETISIVLKFNNKNKKENGEEESEILSLYDTTIQGEEDLYLKMPVVQELRVVFLNEGAILQDIIKETYELYTHYIHVYYFPG